MWPYEFTGFDHVQLAMPPGGEDQARAFYCGILGMMEIPKPEALAKRGGAWFVCGRVELHLGVETDFRPALKAHPAIRVREYDALLAKLRDAGVPVREDEEVPGVRRAHTSDPFGNRIELIAD